MKTHKEISAGIVIYRRTKDGPKFLLMYSGRGYWNFPKGKLEEDEQSIGAAFREVAEETGLKQRDLSLRQTFRAADKYLIFRERKRIFKTVIFYLAESKSDKIIVSGEHDGYGWFLYGDARKILKFHNSKDIIKKVKEFLMGDKKT